MSKQQDSNVIHIDFSSRKENADKSTKPFTHFLNDVVPSPYDDSSDVFEELTPKERHDQLKKDLEFLRQMNDSPTMKR